MLIIFLVFSVDISILGRASQPGELVVPYFITSIESYWSSNSVMTPFRGGQSPRDRYCFNFLYQSRQDVNQRGVRVQCVCTEAGGLLYVATPLRLTWQKVGGLLLCWIIWNSIVTRSILNTRMIIRRTAETMRKRKCLVTMMRYVSVCNICECVCM